MHRIFVLCLAILSYTTGYSQTPWSTFLDSSRAINWSSAGFTIPSYVTNCTTQPTGLVASSSGAASANTTAITNALASCDATHNVVNIPAGTYYISGLTYPAHGKQILRGAGPSSTKLISTSQAACEGFQGGICFIDASPVYTGSTEVQYGTGTQACNWTGGLTQGSTSITLSSCGGTPPNNHMLVLDQIVDQTDNGGVYICNETTPFSCNYDGTGGSFGRPTRNQTQTTFITNVVSLGGGSYTVTISPAVYFTNVQSGRNPGAWWPGQVQNDGLENLTVDGTSDATNTLNMYDCYQCWVKNVTFLNGARASVVAIQSLFPVIRDSYFYQSQSASPVSYNIESELTSGGLAENNIMQQTALPIIINNGTGWVIDYNFAIASKSFATGFVGPAFSSHSAGNQFNLWEGNNFGGIIADDAWGSTTQQTYFRNMFIGWKSGATGGTTPIIHRSYVRGMNVIGNILGQPSVHTRYQTIALTSSTYDGGNEDVSIYDLGLGHNGSTICGAGTPQTAPFCDPIAVSSLMRWANYDVVTAGVKFDSTEASPGAVPFLNANFTSSYFSSLAHTLPASFYYSSIPSWWPSGKAWPPIGPDIGSGNVGICTGTFAGSQAIAGGQCSGGSLLSAWASHITSIPAQDCFLNTMNGPPDGSGSVLVFNATTCYIAVVNQTWYIRADGGTRYSADNLTGQCDGLADAPYPGSGVNQHCAYIDYRYLYDSGGFGVLASHWVIAGGDTVFIRNGPWRVGFNQGASSGDFWCKGLSGAGACTNPPIPAGTNTQPTIIEGENFATCGAPGQGWNGTQLFGGFSVGAVLDLSSTQYVQVKCIELTDHSQCIQHGDFTPDTNPEPCSSSFPLSDYASDGIHTTNSTANVTLDHVYIHGLTNRGVIGPIGGLVTANFVRIGYNGMAGWDFDRGDSQASVNGDWHFTNSLIEFSGCDEEYPITHTYPARYCFSQSSGGYGDGVGTPFGMCMGVTVTNSQSNFNTQDAWDLGHLDTRSGFPVCYLTASNNYSFGNGGAALLKWGPAPNPQLMVNSIGIANCLRMSVPLTGAPTTYNKYQKDFCRAGDSISFNGFNDTVSTVANNTIVAYAPTTFDIGCNDPTTCAGTQINMWNNIVLGYDNPATYTIGGNPGGPGGYCLPGCNSTTHAFGHLVTQYNDYNHVRTITCPTGNTGEICGSPALTSQPTGQAGTFNETQLDVYLPATVNNIVPTGGSPVSLAGKPGGYTGMPLLDYFNVSYTNPAMMGAAVPSGVTPTVATPTCTPVPGTYPTTTSVTCTSTTSGVTFCGTMNNSTPTSLPAGTCLNGGGNPYSITNTNQAFSGLQSTGSTGTWVLCLKPSCDPGGSGTGTGSFAQGVSTPLSSDTMTLTVNGANVNGLLFKHLSCPTSGCPNVTTMTWDEDFYIPSSSNHLQALEFDPDLYTGTNRLFASAQCDIAGTGKWRYWNTAGNTWVTSTHACSLSTNATHHIQIVATFNVPANSYTIASHIVDGVTICTGCGTFTGLADGGTATINAEQQIDNNGTATSNVMYYSNITLSVTSNTNLKVIGTKSGFLDSAIGSYIYNIAPLVANPTCTPPPNTYTTAQTVTCTSTTPGAIVCGAINDTPTASGGFCTHGSVGPFNITGTSILNTIATKAGSTNSGLVLNSYTITASPTVTVTITIQNGVIQNVTSH